MKKKNMGRQGGGRGRRHLLSMSRRQEDRTQVGHGMGVGEKAVYSFQEKKKRDTTYLLQHPPPSLDICILQVPCSSGIPYILALCVCLCKLFLCFCALGVGCHIYFKT